ncbi:hypothetical protein PR003_g5614 [Phytophthora rubi]|uniref:Uncharacterized protein n=1 Tax=Phytophthora rubi TaxID=129364 RepID=A0A6A3NAT8_9STRA|nr:hypothetical protein PR002_g5711 [Phytophthora rubi]KAE9349935.1 hypothetical protein PR003_g5614 [Phytophthora rubi]
MLVGLFFLLAVELMRVYPRPTPSFVEPLLDLTLAAMLGVAGIVMVCQLLEPSATTTKKRDVASFWMTAPLAYLATWKHLASSCSRRSSIICIKVAAPA